MSHSDPVVLMGDLMVDINAIVGSLEDVISARGSDLPSPISITPGGSASNTALWLTDLGASTIFLGSVGDDMVGKSALSYLAARGIETCVRIDPDLATGMCIVLSELDGSRTMIPSAGANASMSELDLHNLWPTQPIQHFHLSSYALFHQRTGNAALGALKRARSAGVTISCDPSAHTLIRPNFDRITESMALSHVILANWDETLSILQAAGIGPFPQGIGHEDALVAMTAFLNDRNVGDYVFVATLGASGAIAIDRHAHMTNSRIPPNSEVVSTTGAGDAFNAGFLHAWLRDPHDIEGALHAGNMTAAHAIRRVGAGPGAM